MRTVFAASWIAEMTSLEPVGGKVIGSSGF
jgi:hypothetical protein